MSVPKRKKDVSVKDEVAGLCSDLDIGFRVLKVDSPNVKDTYYAPAEINQQMLLNMESNIKPDRTELDLFFGCVLDLGLMLSHPYKCEQLEGAVVYTYNEDDLVGCFDESISIDAIIAIAERKPKRVVFRDDSFPDSSMKIKADTLFRLFSPETKVMVI